MEISKKISYFIYTLTFLCTTVFKEVSHPPHVPVHILVFSHRALKVLLKIYSSKLPLFSPRVLICHIFSDFSESQGNLEHRYRTIERAQIIVAETFRKRIRFYFTALYRLSSGVKRGNISLKDYALQDCESGRSGLRLR